MLLSFRVRSIENDGRYKRTWGTGSETASTEGGEGGVVSSQPTSHHNGQATTAASGPYVKRCTDDYLLVQLNNVTCMGKKYVIAKL